MGQVAWRQQTTGYYEWALPMDSGKVQILFAQMLLGDYESEEAWAAVDALRVDGSRDERVNHNVQFKGLEPESASAGCLPEDLPQSQDREDLGSQAFS